MLDIDVFRVLLVVVSGSLLLTEIGLVGRLPRGLFKLVVVVGILVTLVAGSIRRTVVLDARVMSPFTSDLSVSGTSAGLGIFVPLTLNSPSLRMTWALRGALTRLLNVMLCAR